MFGRYGLSDKVWENTQSTVYESLIITVFSKFFIKQPRHQSDSTCELPPESQILEKKSQTIFSTLTTSKKSQICEIWRQKNNLATLSFRSLAQKSSPFLWRNLDDKAARGGRSHFFRLQLRCCSKIFESGSGNFSTFRIRLLFKLRLQSSIQP